MNWIENDVKTKAAGTKPPQNVETETDVAVKAKLS
jgi:hypothetical protein